MAAIPVMAQAASSVGIDLSEVEPIMLSSPVVIKASVGETPQERQAFLIEQQAVHAAQAQALLVEQAQEVAYQEYITTLEVFYASARTIYPDWMKPHMPEYQ
jgi:hypothetical protein